jgi:lipopolysaccharide cholinephosphotransferase
MTETERIIQNGILPASFLEPEVRDDFMVTKDRKKLWAVELDLLLKFDDVCKRHGLKYFLNSGSLLGAIRHKGFIPWDDDIDVEMPRDDYEKLLSLTNEFKQPYFLQLPTTDRESAYSFAKLRNSNTIMTSKTFLFQKMNHGVCIDIFPYDNWVSSDSASYDIIKYLAYENSTFMRRSNPHLDANNQLRVKTWTGIPPLVAYECINKIAQRYKNVDTDSIVIIVSSITKYESKICLKEYYKEAVMADFECFQFPVPVGYDSVLTKYYGDYMKFPPVEKRGTWHKDAIIDADMPYEEYLKKKENYPLEIFDDNGDKHA